MIVRWMSVVAGSLVLAACASSGPKADQSKCSNCGEVQSVSEQRPEDQLLSSAGSGLGAPRGLAAPSAQSLPSAGGLVGGVSGAARTAGSIDPQSAFDSARSLKVYEVDVKMDDGSTRRVITDALGSVKQGDRVKVIGNRLIPVI